MPRSWFHGQRCACAPQRGPTEQPRAGGCGRTGRKRGRTLHITFLFLPILLFTLSMQMTNWVLIRPPHIIYRVRKMSRPHNTTVLNSTYIYMSSVIASYFFPLETGFPFTSARVRSACSRIKPLALHHPTMTGLEPAIPRSEVWCLIH